MVRQHAPSSAVVRRIGYSRNRLRSEIARNISFSRALIRNVRSALADFGCRALRLPRQQCRVVGELLFRFGVTQCDIALNLDTVPIRQGHGNFFYVVKVQDKVYSFPIPIEDAKGTTLFAGSRRSL